ncbi:MAG: hypothetical protein BLITH_0740 [Brockia lithotrophica]|uniref:Uncharacterized protein n=1 Tax=Brockia lithotrophica TaxID=933949 RepID=A0A2T5G8P2_9BACL|nr:MAG: hypothetical protein BLITH_0740 [Brockia lithotrophica]
MFPRRRRRTPGAPRQDAENQDGGQRKHPNAAKRRPPVNLRALHCHFATPRRILDAVFPFVRSVHPDHVVTPLCVCTNGFRGRAAPNLGPLTQSQQKRPKRPAPELP